MNTKTYLILFSSIALLLFPNSVRAKAPATLSGYQASVDALKQSSAYKRYAQRPKSELSKLLFLMERFRSMEASIVFDGFEYDANKSSRMGKKYLMKNYKKKETAEKWIQLHTYRSPKKGEVIYIKLRNGTYDTLRNALLQEMKALEKA